MRTTLIALIAIMSTTTKAETIGDFDFNLNKNTKTAELTAYKGTDTELTIPPSISYEGETYTVTSLGEYCFSYSLTLTSITIPETVTSLGEYCFSSCYSLTALNIPASVTKIGFRCIISCPALTAISVDKNNQVYDSREDCNALIETATNTMIRGCQSTFIPSTVEKIDDYCFSECGTLTDITIPSSVKSIGESSFMQCVALTDITIPSSVTSIGNSCFSGCIALEKITVDPNNQVYDSRDNSNAIIETATNTLIAGCKSSTIPTTVTRLGENSFADCSTLTDITIPESVTSLGLGSFSKCI